MVKVIHCVSGTIDGRQETQTETEQGEYSYYNYPNRWWVPSPLFLRGGGACRGGRGVHRIKKVSGGSERYWPKKRRG